MSTLPQMNGSGSLGPESVRHYNELIKQSVRARARGDHWAAQQLASEAHRFAMEEQTRLQRLMHAEEALAQAKRQLQSAWDKAPECETVEELQEQHPEYKRLITAWENATQQVQDLSEPQIEDSDVLKQFRAAW
jgi:hypothetical protein